MGSSQPSEDTYVSDKQAEMAAWLEEDWEARFKPIEEGLINELMNRDAHIREDVEQAGEAAKKSYDATVGMAERSMERYGTEMDADQQAAQDRENSMNSQGVEISARNMAREGSTMRYEGMQNNMVSLGRGVQMQGMQGLNQAGAMEAQRNAQNQQIYAQNQASMYGMMGTAASTAGMMFMMSDKNTKKNVKKASAKKALKTINDVDLKHFDYKDGMGGGRPEKGHIGGMAQDMPKGLTTPDRKQVDVGDTLMTVVGGVQELSKKIDKLEKKEKGHGRR